MNTFIGVNMIQAEPMNKWEALQEGLLKAKDGLGIDPDLAEEGYKVVYPDGYKSWSPARVFERRFFQLEDPTKISIDDIDKFAKRGESHKLGLKTCVVLDTTITGFDMIGTSACVDPANYNQTVGENIARKDIVDKLWGHLGFVLQWAKNGLSK